VCEASPALPMRAQLIEKFRFGRDRFGRLPVAVGSLRAKCRSA
jgi:hypothetical protein